MKNLLYLILVIMVFGCDPDNNSTPEPVKSLPDLNIDIAKTYVPVDLLKNSSRAVFVNESGDEKSLEIEFIVLTREQKFKGIEYKAPYIQIRYLENNGLVFLPQIRIQAEYNDYNSVNEVVNINIITAVNEGFIPNILILRTGQPIIGEIAPSMEIVNKLFANVYSNFSPPAELNSYAHLHYTTTQGIIAFQGEEGIMWALDRLE